MKEEYFKGVISKISDLYYEIREKESSNNEDEEFKSLFFDEFELEAYHFNRKELVDYLNSLTDTTLNVICALMDFGRRYNCKVLPINLNNFFNKYYLPYWFDKNKTEDKNDTVYYLVSKKSLPEYLSRAKFILFDSKKYNIDLVHECGGSLCLEESDGVEQIEYDTYELHLMCLKCDGRVSKIVDEDFFNKKII